MATPRTTPPADNGRRLLTPDEVATILRLDALGIRTPRRSVLRMVRRGQLRGISVAGRILVTAESVDSYIDGKPR